LRSHGAFSGGKKKQIKGIESLTDSVDVEAISLMRTQELIGLEDRYGAHNYRPLDVVIQRGEGVWVYDVEGNRYLDCLSAYSALNHGHRHPRIVEALTAQASNLTLTSRAFRNDQLPLFYQEVCELTGYEMALPMNTGVEAVETAIKAARKWGYTAKQVPDGQAEIITFTGNFHGRTLTVISSSTEPGYKAGFSPFTPGFVTVPYGDAKALRDAINPNTVAVLLEPIQGEGGVIVPPEGYLQAVRRICSECDVLMMADEIQTGLGRTGRLFACDHEDVKPDVMILGKALCSQAACIRCRWCFRHARCWASSSRVTTDPPSAAIRWAARWPARPSRCWWKRV
jgi:ornithine--oxo-acid transaminase